MKIRIRFLKHWKHPYRGDSYEPGDTTFLARATAEILCKYGIAETLEFSAAEGIVVDEPSAIAVNANTGYIEAFLEGEHSQNGRVELDCTPPETDHAVPPLRKLPHSPSRSLGGYLDYAGWSDSQRFMELDGAIQRQGRESVYADRNADSDDSQLLRPVRRCSATPGEGCRCKNIFRSPSDYTGTKYEEHRTDPSFAVVIKGLEDLPLRRL